MDRAKTAITQLYPGRKSAERTGNNEDFWTGERTRGGSIPRNLQFDSRGITVRNTAIFNTRVCRVFPIHHIVSLCKDAEASLELNSYSTQHRLVLQGVKWFAFLNLPMELSVRIVIFASVCCIAGPVVFSHRRRSVDCRSPRRIVRRTGKHPGGLSAGLGTGCRCDGGNFT